MKNKSFWIIVIISLAVFGLVIAAVVLGNKNSGSETALANFAQCLTQKGAVFYGAKWCSYCQKQRSLFDSSFKFINYVDCEDNPKQCIEAKIEGYPTWVFSGGLKLIGLQSLERLSQASGCAL